MGTRNFRERDGRSRKVFRKNDRPYRMRRGGYRYRQRIRRKNNGEPMRIVLAGNPNAGKSTLFNSLTGESRRVGNWHGVTVDEGEAVYRPRERKRRIGCRKISRKGRLRYNRHRYRGENRKTDGKARKRDKSLRQARNSVRQSRKGI